MKTQETVVESWSTLHALTPEDAATIGAMRKVLKPHKGQLRGTAARKPFDDVMEHTPAATGVIYEADTVGGVPGWWCRPANARSAESVLYLHGGRPTLIFHGGYDSSLEELFYFGAAAAVRRG
jgi:monoterpene epsilon-lactone hydrolase